MAKTNGLSWSTLSVDDASGTAQTIKNDITDLQFATPRAVQDITGVDKAAHERQLLLADFTCTVNGVANFATNAAHDVFKTVSSTSVARTLTLTVASKTLANEVICTDYQMKRGNGGELTFSVPMSLADGTVPVWA